MNAAVAWTPDGARLNDALRAGSETITFHVSEWRNVRAALNSTRLDVFGEGNRAAVSYPNAEWVKAVMSLDLVISWRMS